VRRYVLLLTGFFPQPNPPNQLKYRNKIPRRQIDAKKIFIFSPGDVICAGQNPVILGKYRLI